MQKRINILHISRTSKLTGPENIFLDIVRKTDREKLRFTVVLPDKRGDFYRRLEAGGVDVIIKRMPFLRTTANPALLIWFLLNISFINISLMSVAARRRIDIIECNTIHEMMFVILPLKLLGKKLVFYYKNILDKRWKKKIRAWLSDRFAHSIIAVSRKTLEDYLLYGKRKDRKIVRVVYDGIDCTGFRGTADDGDAVIPGVNKDDFIILNIGNLTELKGQLLLLKAVNSDSLKDPGLKVVIIGDLYHESELHYKEEIERYIKANSLGDKVIMAGYKDNIAGYLKKGHMLVHCPIKDDAFPRIILEAFCCSKVVVATEVGGIPEIIEDGYNGFLCRPDAEDLGKKIFYVYKNFDKLGRIREKAFEKASCAMNVDKQAADMQDIYERVLAKA